ncbi:glycosyl hydrolase family 28-related protein [Peribacillus sp. RS7]|uniref:glycosyl hydrolase family 28-related protein n=1 Tax=Peribacillus sp. RS7 TaxID=3242679 RepID=UPI0035BFF666
MKRRNFILNFFLMILAFFFGYTIKKDGTNMTLQRIDTSMVRGKYRRTVAEEIGDLSEFKARGNSITEKATNEFTDRGINIKWFGAKGDAKEDDTASIITAISTLSDGDTLFFPKGTYLVSNTIFIDKISNIRLLGSSGAIIKKKETGREYSLLYIYKTENLIVENISFIGFRNKIENLVKGDYGLKIQSGNNIKIINCIFKNFADSCFGVGAKTNRDLQNIQTSNNIWVLNNYFENVWQTSTTPAGAKNYFFENNVVKDLFGSLKFASRNSLSNNIKILNNIISGVGNGSTGIEVANYMNLEIEGNIINNVDYGINFYINQQASSYPTNIETININNNIITNASVSGVRISNKSIAKKIGIFSVKITSNTIKNCSGFGINFSGNKMENIDISQNLIKSVSGDNILISCDYEEDNGKIIIRNNIIDDFKTFAVNIQNNNSTNYVDVYVDNNKGFSDITNSLFLCTTKPNKYNFFIESNNVKCYSYCLIISYALRLTLRENDFTSSNGIAVNLSSKESFVRNNNIKAPVTAIRHDNGSTGITYTIGNFIEGTIENNGQTLTSLS